MGVSIKAWPDQLEPSEANLALIVDPAPGDVYLIDGDGWQWDGADWTNIGPIQGPPGERGPQGEPGTNGTNGTNGQDGAPGATGPRGKGWFTGAGAPQEPIGGSIAGDLYLNTVNGDVYELAGAA
jgi:hypothetical protein